MRRTIGKSRRGLTLIEILLALIVMVLGIVGILALFPPALDNAKESMEVTTAAIVGESVANSLTNAVRFAQYDPTSGNWSAVLSHDLEAPGGSKSVTYQFTLPRFSTDGMTANKSGSHWKHHPGGLNSGGELERMPAFTLGGDPWTKATLENHREANDPTDPLDQFAFAFRIRKINTLNYLVGQLKPNGSPYTEADLEPLTKLYEFQIFMYRLFKSQAAVGKGTTVEELSQKQPKRVIASVTSRASTK